MVENIISVGKKAIRNTAISAILSLSIINLDIWYVKTKLNMEKRNGKNIVANSLIPNSLKDMVARDICPILNKNTGYPM